MNTDLNAAFSALADPTRRAILARLAKGEAGAMELAGYRPCMVQGQHDNIKITVPSDLELAAFYLQTGKRP